MAKVKLNDVRLAFPAIWRPEAVQQADGSMGKPKFGATFLFAKTHPAFELIQKAIREEATKKWADKASTMLTALKGEGRLCFKNGDTKPEYDGFAGNYFVRASAEARPSIFDRDGMTPLVEAAGTIYGGCFVNAVIEIWCQQNKWGKRVNATLKGLQFVRRGDAFGAGPPATADDFEDLGGGSSESDDALETETVGADDDLI